MNKKILIVMAVVSFIFANSASAAILPSRDIIAPDSPFYFLQTWKESIQTFFTFGAENKAKQYLHLAEIRLNEYQNLIDKGKTEIAEKTLNKYEEQLNRALTKAQELKDKGKDIKDLSQKIEETVGKHLEVLQENLQKVPEAAKKGIENAIENSQKGIEKISGKKSCAEEGKMCGGIAGILCCSGLKCQIQGNYPDASGTCVKEEKKNETASWKNCNGYEVSMNKEEIKRCTCPEGYKKFQGLGRAYCATDSRKPCNTHTDCSKGEHCISDDGKNWFCTGRYTGCYFSDPEYPTVQLCGD